MTKQMTSRDNGSARPKAAGKTTDGVVILAPATRPTHFTRREIERTIRDIRRPESGSRRPG
jgi:hypothetical protein